MNESADKSDSEGSVDELDAVTRSVRVMSTFAGSFLIFLTIQGYFVTI